MLLLFSYFSFAAPAWIQVDGATHLSVEDWAKLSDFQVFPDKKSGRILFEHKKKAPLILLLDSPHALAGKTFLALPSAPFVRSGKILLASASAERLGLVPPAEKSAAPAKGATCGRKVKRIFLDPGHGGEDSGTTHGSIREKNVVLTFARLAAEELKRNGFEVSYSRSKDIFLPLDIRTKIAEKWKADIFISLHVNSSPMASAHGTETYILSPDATDAEARKLALLENSIAEKAKASESAVQDILWDMEQNVYLQESAYLAADIQGAIVDEAHKLLAKKKISGDWKNRGVRQAPFYVLNRAPMPATLVELGYLSNPGDRKLLDQKFFLESLAKALAIGVKKYQETCPTK